MRGGWGGRGCPSRRLLRVGMGVVAPAFDGEIGVGLKLDDTTFDPNHFAQDFFSPEEIRWLTGL